MFRCQVPRASICMPNCRICTNIFSRIQAASCIPECMSTPGFTKPFEGRNANPNAFFENRRIQSKFGRISSNFQILNLNLIEMRLVSEYEPARIGRNACICEPWSTLNKRYNCNYNCQGRSCCSKRLLYNVLTRFH